MFENKVVLCLGVFKYSVSEDSWHNQIVFTQIEFYKSQQKKSATSAEIEQNEVQNA